MPSKIVDIHPHIVSRDTVRYPVTPIGGTRSEWSKERSVTLEELLAAMDEGGVDKAAIVHSSTTYGFNNDYVVDAVAAHPKRFTGVFSVNITEPYAAASDFFTLGDLPNVYLKLTLSGLNGMIKGKADTDTFIPKLVSVFGADRIAWGSNYPATAGTMGEIIATSRKAMRALSTR